MNNTLFRVAVILIHLYLSSVCFAQAALPTKIISSTGAVFQSLGDLPGGDFESSAQAVSADGKIITGTAKTENGSQSFYWTEETGLVSLGNLADNSFNKSQAYDISGDGKVIVGAGDVGSGWNTHKGFAWTEETGMTLLGSVDNSTRYEVFASSSDGSVIVGDGGRQIFRWTEETGCVGLGTLPGRNASRGVDVSDDGSVIVGSSYNLPNWDSEQAYKWTEENGIVGLGFLPNSNYSFAIAVSNDGNVVVGTGYASGTYPAFKWTQESGMVNIGHLPGKTTTHPQDMTADGSVIVGGSFGDRGANAQAFIWDENNGMRNLQSILQNEYGLDLTGWNLEMASGITPDGKVIVGRGINPSGNQEAFRVLLDTTFTDINEARTIIDDYKLEQNYPNPFNPSTQISYTLYESGNIRLEIFNSLGQNIKTLLDNYQEAGEHSVIWNGTNNLNENLSSGIYFYALSTNNHILNKKMILLR